jgi:hypothetical protein
MSSCFFPVFTVLTRRASGALAVAALAASALPSAHAVGVGGRGTWETTLQGRDLDGNLSNGPEAFFDTVLNVTWLADANFAKTSGYASGYGYDAEGKTGWHNAQYWAAQLSVNGVTGWRLPDVKPVNGSGFDNSYSLDGSTDLGFNITSTQSELAHLFHVTLGNKGIYDDSVNSQWGFGLQNSGPFKNVQADRYWSDVAYAPTTSGVWYFGTSIGVQTWGFSYDWALAWAVHPGDVGVATAVPEPQTYALALAGLAAMAVARKRSHR